MIITFSQVVVLFKSSVQLKKEIIWYALQITFKSPVFIFFLKVKLVTPLVKALLKTCTSESHILMDYKNLHQRGGVS